MSEPGSGIAFDATVVASPRGSGALVWLPDDSALVFQTRARFPVRATFNGVSYRGSAMPMGGGRFGLGLTKAVRTAAAVGVGDTVHVVVARDDEARTVEAPDDLSSALRAAGLDDRFGALAYTHQRDYVSWVTAAKCADTRENRVARAVAMVRAGKALS